ncbi:hypothetical protein BS50DRAFT_86085 [Corynespora cassiicola Philippines]|uniref:Uncharacterized protein n=1 Tax=Corynespora cassiicola Philippines TaxID=1448308 RepID=A0A2T2NE51_CORCC|nr:hypothetical protein BS50DRAFT_86085 [Corynespora cassiicola Philippines]
MAPSSGLLQARNPPCTNTLLSEDAPCPPAEQTHGKCPSSCTIFWLDSVGVVVVKSPQKMNHPLVERLLQPCVNIFPSLLLYLILAHRPPNHNPLYELLLEKRIKRTVLLGWNGNHHTPRLLLLLLLPPPLLYNYNSRFVVFDRGHERKRKSYGMGMRNGNIKQHYIGHRTNDRIGRMN